VCRSDSSDPLAKSPRAGYSTSEAARRKAREPSSSSDVEAPGRTRRAKTSTRTSNRYESRLRQKIEDMAADLPDRSISPHRNLVMQQGFAAIDTSLGRFEAAYRAALDKGDTHAAAAALREVRYWGARRASAEVVTPPSHKRRASFGMTVTVRRADGRAQTFRIVGEDEADPRSGTVSYVCPRSPEPSSIARQARPSRLPARRSL
jgi:transcription elongation GreA/GreB family factor